MTVITTVEFTQVVDKMDGESVTLEDIERFRKKLQKGLEKLTTADHTEITKIQVFPTHDL